MHKYDKNNQNQLQVYNEGTEITDRNPTKITHNMMEREMKIENRRDKSRYDSLV